MKTLNPNIVAQETARPTVLPPDKTLLDMLYYMKLTRELEFRIERKLYRQGKIVGRRLRRAGPGSHRSRRLHRPPAGRRRVPVASRHGRLS